MIKKAIAVMTSGGDSMKLLSFISENYLSAHLGRHFRTLEFYKSITDEKPM